MKRHRPTTPPCMIWLALVAMFALACGPSVSRLMPQDETARLMALAFCGGDAGHALSLMRTASQARLPGAGSDRPGAGGADVDATTAGDSRPGDDARIALECPLCSVAAGHLLAPPDFIVREPLRLVEGPPARFFTSARPLFAWAAVRSRGPPAV